MKAAANEPLALQPPPRGTGASPSATLGQWG